MAKPDKITCLNCDLELCVKNRREVSCPVDCLHDYKFKVVQGNRLEPIEKPAQPSRAAARAAFKPNGLKLLAKKKTFAKKQFSKKKQKPMNARSKDRAKEERLYSKNKADYMQDHVMCEACNSKQAGELHHKAGRIGFLLYTKKFFMSVCHDCHHHMHFGDTKGAEEKGWIVRLNMEQFRIEKAKVLND
jgi:hypothetical protein